MMESIELLVTGAQIVISPKYLIFILLGVIIGMFVGALPGINGMEVSKNLKANPKTQNIKVIAISGDLRHSEKVILESGADMYFTKPVDFDVLLEACNKFVRDAEEEKVAN